MGCHLIHAGAPTSADYSHRVGSHLRLNYPPGHAADRLPAQTRAVASSMMWL